MLHFFLGFLTGFVLPVILWKIIGLMTDGGSLKDKQFYEYNKARLYFLYLAICEMHRVSPHDIDIRDFSLDMFERFVYNDIIKN